MNNRRLYIAYGSNMNLPQMAFRCPTAKPVGTALLADHELLFRGGRRGAVATVAPKEGFIVPVLVWDIKPRDEMALDQYEGYPYFYGKQMMDVELGDKSVPAMAYVMTPGHSAGYPSEFYLNVIAEGYKSAGFDLGILDAAVERTKNIMAEEMERFTAENEHELEDGPNNLFSMKWW